MGYNVTFKVAFAGLHGFLLRCVLGLRGLTAALFVKKNMQHPPPPHLGPGQLRSGSSAVIN